MIQRYSIPFVYLMSINTCLLSLPLIAGDDDWFDLSSLCLLFVVVPFFVLKLKYNVLGAHLVPNTTKYVALEIFCWLLSVASLGLGFVVLNFVIQNQGIGRLVFYILNFILSLLWVVVILYAIVSPKGLPKVSLESAIHIIQPTGFSVAEVLSIQALPRAPAASDAEDFPSQHSQQTSHQSNEEGEQAPSIPDEEAQDMEMPPNDSTDNNETVETIETHEQQDNVEQHSDLEQESFQNIQLPRANGNTLFNRPLPETPDDNENYSALDRNDTHGAFIVHPGGNEVNVSETPSLPPRPANLFNIY